MAARQPVAEAWEPPPYPNHPSLFLLMFLFLLIFLVIHPPPPPPCQRQSLPWMLTSRGSSC
eukprot:657932-Pyramimonas_sp.AAC.1